MIGSDTPLMGEAAGHASPGAARGGGRGRLAVITALSLLPALLRLIKPRSPALPAAPARPPLRNGFIKSRVRPSLPVPCQLLPDALSLPALEAVGIVPLGQEPFPHGEQRPQELPGGPREPGVGSYRLALQRMAGDLLSLRRRVASLEAENGHLRHSLAQLREPGQLRDTDLDVMTREELQDRLATLARELAAGTAEMRGLRDRVQRLQNELIRKNDREKELVLLQRCHRQQQLALRRCQDRVAKARGLEQALRQQEKASGGHGLGVTRTDLGARGAPLAPPGPPRGGHTALASRWAHGDSCALRAGDRGHGAGAAGEAGRAGQEHGESRGWVQEGTGTLRDVPNPQGCPQASWELPGMVQGRSMEGPAGGCGGDRDPQGCDSLCGDALAALLAENRRLREELARPPRAAAAAAPRAPALLPANSTGGVSWGAPPAPWGGSSGEGGDAAPPLPVPLLPCPQGVLGGTEKLWLLARLEEAQARGRALESQLEEAARRWGREKQELGTRLLEREHGLPLASKLPAISVPPRRPRQALPPLP
ncbi:coiled-coil domain-containing protein 33 [Corvus moneduloides]|uniref:coiled-coil domain-containing protein 33 n=1 Tax=Corvus moneduloides TaxID=1196302 RepID=UPI00136321D9|nr:coiled-coil domain-containing protein 33 [Corvus moneduloides]